MCRCTTYVSSAGLVLQCACDKLAASLTIVHERLSLEPLMRSVSADHSEVRESTLVFKMLSSAAELSGCDIVMQQSQVQGPVVSW